MRVPALIVSLADLPPDGLDLELNITPDEVAAMASAEGQEVPTVTSGLTGRLVIRRLGRRLALRGGFQVKVKIPCDRCLADREAALTGEVNEMVNLVFPDDPTAEDGDPDGSLPVVDGRVDLTGLMGEFFWLAWPFRFICRPDCAGLCPRCGADLNDGLCGCDNFSDLVN